MADPVTSLASAPIPAPSQAPPGPTRAFLLATLRDALAGYAELGAECEGCDSTVDAFSSTCERLREAVSRLNGEISARYAEIPAGFVEGVSTAVRSCHASLDALQSSLERTEVGLDALDAMRR